MERWTDEFAARVRGWCEEFAPLAADALLHAGLVTKSDIERTSAIVADELFARFCVDDFPPIPNSSERSGV